MSTQNYTLGVLQKTIDDIISIRELNVIVTPLEPPLIQITKGKKIINQKLGKFFRANTVYTDETIKELVENYKEINSDLSSYKVKYTTDYVNAYKTPLYAIDSTCVSCMTGEDAVRVYDYDERLKLLTIYKNSQLIGRTLVRNDHKEYVRLYLDHNNIKSHIANAIVEREGYKKGNLHGIKLDYIKDRDRTICPYLDGCQDLEISADETYLIIGTGEDLKADQTNGYVDDNHIVECECCGNRFDEEDIYYADNQNLCVDCLNENYIYIEEYGEYVHNDYVVYIESNETYYHQDSSDIVYVESEGAHFLVEDTMELNDGTIELAENYVTLVEPIEDADEEYILKEDAIYIEPVPTYFTYVKEGYYLTEQLEGYVIVIEELLENLQEDLFTDVRENLDIELHYITGKL